MFLEQTSSFISPDRELQVLWPYFQRGDKYQTVFTTAQHDSAQGGSSCN